MSIADLALIAGFLIALSAASERLVTALQALIPWLAAPAPVQPPVAPAGVAAPAPAAKYSLKAFVLILLGFLAAWFTAAWFAADTTTNAKGANSAEVRQHDTAATSSPQAGTSTTGITADTAAVMGPIHFDPFGAIRLRLGPPGTAPIEIQVLLVALLGSLGSPFWKGLLEYVGLVRVVKTEDANLKVLQRHAEEQRQKMKVWQIARSRPL